MKNRRSILRSLGALAATCAALLAIGTPAAATETTASEKPSEELVIFVQPDAPSEIARRFQAEHLPAIRDVAAELGVPVTVIDVAERGAPAPVHITPLVVYQSARGRAFFQGRYVDTGKLGHFLRTSRAVPPTSVEQVKEDAAVWRRGRSRVLAPIKITSLAGEVPEGHDPAAFEAAAFEAAARDAILDGMTRFERRERVELGPADRAFYMDFHPYVDAEGRLFVSTALFSQFNCIEPVYQGFDEPTEGTLDTAADTFARAARALEAEVARQISTSTIGDGFVPVADTVPAVEWAAIGLELPARSSSVDAAATEGVELAKSWRIAAADPDAGPRLVFRFPAPLERYSGEVGAIRGALVLGDDLSVAGADGWIEAETSSVTMGEASLDRAIREKMIYADEHPVSRFEMSAIEPAGNDGVIAFGRVVQIAAKGTFRLVGREIPLDVKGELEPVIGEDGGPLLRVRAGFDLRLAATFGIEGPDGPTPARDTLVFFLDFLMEPNGDSIAGSVPGESTR